MEPHFKTVLNSEVIKIFVFVNQFSELLAKLLEDLMAHVIMYIVLNSKFTQIYGCKGIYHALS